MQAPCQVVKENIFGTEPLKASQFKSYVHGNYSEYMHFYAVSHRIRMTGTNLLPNHS